MATVAESNGGIIDIDELFALGYRPGAIERRVQRGVLHPIHRGVYAVGHRLLSREACWLAAVRAAGPDALLSHSSGGAHVGMLRWDKEIPEITRPTVLRRPGIRGYRSLVPPDERMVFEGIPVTTPSRTVIDIAATEPERVLAYALNQIEVRQLWQGAAVPELLERHRGRRGVAKLRGLMPDTEDVREAFERRFRDRVRVERWPRPEYNAALALGHDFIVVDVLWREQRLAVELDSRTWHDTSQAFETDRARDRSLRRGGYLPIRITPRQFDEGIQELRERFADAERSLVHPLRG